MVQAQDMTPRQQNGSGDADADGGEEEIERRERSLDEALKETFPASDPPAALAPHDPKK
jgi:hypothetical protein